MLLMDYPSTRGEYLPDSYKKATCKLLHACIDAQSQRLIHECPGYRVHDISRYQPQCADMNFYEKSIYNRLFHKVIHKGGESAINDIKIFQNDKALGISVENSYSEDQLMYTSVENFQQGVKYSAQIASHQV